MGQPNLLHWLREMVRLNGSDLYLTWGAKPMMRGDGGMVPLDDAVLDDHMLSEAIGALTTPDQQGDFERDFEFNMSLDLPKLGRFRVNLYKQRQHFGMVARQVATEIPTLAKLRLPTLLGELCCEKRGLVIVVGGTGSGKSTSLAAMIDYRNEKDYGHILTIEDPIEYLHPHKRCLVSQREVGTDTRSFEAALKNALRQKPDVILLGEIRDAEVMRHALNIAETGHLALATLHANSADQAIERIGSFFEREERRQVMLNLSFNLKGILSQRLVHAAAGGRVAALEIMMADDRVRELIRQGDTKALKAAMAAAGDIGSQTFDQHLLRLWSEGRIDDVVALAECDDRPAMEAAMRLAGAGGGQGEGTA